MYWIIFAIIGGLALSQKQNIQDVIQEQSDSWHRFDASFKKFGAMYDVDWKILKAIALNESSLGDAPSVARGLEVPTDVEGSMSDDGLSWGLMQMTLNTASDFDKNVTAEKLNNADYSIDLSARFLRSLFKQFSLSDVRQLEWVIKSYNQGAGNTRKEIRGQISGYAQEYWDRFMRNLNRVELKP